MRIGAVPAILTIRTASVDDKVIVAKLKNLSPLLSVAPNDSTINTTAAEKFMGNLCSVAAADVANASTQEASACVA